MVAITSPFSPEQQLIRSQGVGASEVAAICGLSPWAGPLDIFLRKTGQSTETPDTEDQAFGRAAEAMARDLYVHQTGRTVTIPGTIVHPTLPLVRATPDWIADGVTTCQAKAPRHWAGWGESGTHDFPELHWIQVTWEMWAAGADNADLVAYLGGERSVRIYPNIPFDLSFAESLYEKVAKFWRDHVMTGIPPKVDGSRAAGEYIRERFPREKHGTYIVDDSPEMVQLVMAYDAVRESAKQETARQAELRNQICARIGDASGVEGKWGKVSFKSSKHSSLDKGALFSAFNIQPSDVAAYTSDSYSRTLRVTLRKGK